MKQLIDKLIAHLELYHREMSAEREQVGSLPLGVFKIQILGQLSLMLNQAASEELQLAATKDVDALLSGDIAMKLETKRALKSFGLEYDELSKEIWIPEGATFTNYYTSTALVISVVDPFSTLIAKAKFAVKKNQQLLLQAIAVYEGELLDAFKKHHIDIDSIFIEAKNES